MTCRPHLCAARNACLRYVWAAAEGRSWRQVAGAMDAGPLIHGWRPSSSFIPLCDQRKVGGLARVIIAIFVVADRTTARAALNRRGFRCETVLQRYPASRYGPPTTAKSGAQTRDREGQPSRRVTQRRKKQHSFPTAALLPQKRRDGTHIPYSAPAVEGESASILGNAPRAGWYHPAARPLRLPAAGWLQDTLLAYRI